MGRKRERVAPLTRWQYFTKTLYSDAASRAEFEYDGVIYFKSEELQRIEAGNRRIHGLLLVILCLVFLSAIRWQNIYFVVACMVIIVAGGGGAPAALAQGHPRPPDRYRPEEVRMTVNIIARIRTELPEKFGVPRQSGLVPQLRGTIVFEPAYRNPDALRGLEGFSHLWLIFQFHQAVREGWSPTVRPPRLGGNRRRACLPPGRPFGPMP